MMQKAVSLVCSVIVLSLFFLSVPDSFALTQEEAKALLSTAPAGSVPLNAEALKSSGNFVPLPGSSPPSTSEKPVEIIEKTVVKPLEAVPDEKPKAAPPPGKSEIEKSMSDPQTDEDMFKPQPFTKGELTQFGYNFFRPDATGFPPQTDVPVGDDYLVGPGDVITLQLWGSVTGSYDLEVNRSGEVYVPRVGAVRVWGVPFGRLQELFRSHLARELKDFQLNVNMGKLRLMKIYVVGEVQSPGGYNVSSLSTVINALSAAGGPTKNGSLRTITVRRQGKPPLEVDLYYFFLKGDKSCDVRLLPGDTIYVPVIRRVAGIAGNVRRPAIFELRNEKNLTELLALAGGINPTGSLQRIQVVRVKAHDKKLVSDFNVDPHGSKKSFLDITGAIKIENFDLVRVFQIDTTLRDHVRIEGYVRRPGDYALKKGMRVKDFFGKDDILPETYNPVAVITRLIPPDYHPEKFSIDLGKALAGDETHNVELQEFDRLKIFSRWEMEAQPVVRINGDVQKPGEYRLLENMRLRDLVYDAGNLKNTAFLDNVEITRIKISGAEVTSQPINVNLKEALAGNPEHNILLQPFDTVQVRRIPNWVEETERYVTLSGEVMFPGTYPIFKGERLSSVLTRAGGYTPKAYLYGAKFTRAPVRQLQQQRMDEFISRTEQDVASKMQSLASTAASKEELEATKASLEGVRQSLEKLKQLKAEGRMTISLAPVETLRTTPYDLELMGGDALYIPQSIGAVTVLGEVYNQTALLHLPGRDLEYYLNEAGGPTGGAEEDEIYLVKADGSVTSRQQSSFGIHWDGEGKKWTFGGFNSLQPQPGDTIVVPKQLEKTAWLRTIKDITTIISQIALTAGTIFIGLK
jgi:protein involved in polysaccharide export with SLBB domain